MIMLKTRPRWQKIKYTDTGRPYIKHYRWTIYFDEVMRVNPPEEINGFKVHGSLGLSNNTALVVEVSNDGEYARAMLCS